MRPRGAATGCEVLRCCCRSREEGSGRNTSSVDGWTDGRKALAFDVDCYSGGRRAAARIITRIFGPANIAEKPGVFGGPRITLDQTALM